MYNDREAHPRPVCQTSVPHSATLLLPNQGKLSKQLEQNADRVILRLSGASCLEEINQSMAEPNKAKTYQICTCCRLAWRLTLQE